MKKLLLKGSVVALLGLLAASPASAGAFVLDFSGLPGGLNATPTLVPAGGGPSATIGSSTGWIFVGPGAAGQADGFCFTTNPTSDCEHDGAMTFSSAVTNLMFDTDGFNSGDVVTISAYLGATLLGSQVISSNTLVDFSAFGLLNRVVFDDSSTGAGFGYSTITYDAAATVPEPTTLLLLGTGLAFAVRRQRMKKRA